jgi:hypothetical protein
MPLGEIEQTQQRSLARAAGTGDEIEAAGVKREADVAQNFAFGAVSQADIVELNDFPVG